MPVLSIKEKNISFFDKTFFVKESFPSSFGKAFLLLLILISFSPPFFYRFYTTNGDDI